MTATKRKLEEKHLNPGIVHVASASIGTIAASIVRVRLRTEREDHTGASRLCAAVRLTSVVSTSNGHFVTYDIACILVDILKPSIDCSTSWGWWAEQVPADTLKHRVQAYMHPNGMH